MKPIKSIQRWQCEHLEPRLALTAQLIADGNTSPIVPAQIAQVDSGIYFTTRSGAEFGVQFADGSGVTQISQHVVEQPRNGVPSEFAVPVDDGLMYGFIPSFFAENLASAAYQIWHVAPGQTAQMVRELPVMNAFGEYQPPELLADTGSHLLIQDATSRLHLIDSSGTTVSSWMAPIDVRCGSPIYGDAAVDRDGIVIEASYACNQFLSPLFVRVMQDRLVETEVHPSSDYLANGTRVITRFTREALADELFFQTQAGTQVVRIEGSPVHPQELTRLNDRLVYFSGELGSAGREPWITDGTLPGTRLLKDISPTGSSYPTVIGHTPHGIIISASDDAVGRELWITDGTEEGTQLLKDITPGILDSSLESVITSTFDADLAVQETLFVWLQNGEGRELWGTDGTAAGTVRLTDYVFSEQVELNAIQPLANGMQALAFSGSAADHRIVISDGTEAGTNVIDSLPENGRIAELSASPVESRLLAVRLASNEIYLVNQTDGSSMQVWSEDDSLQTQSLLPKNITAYGERVLFTTDEADKSRVWIWDPTTTQLQSPGIIAIGSEMTIRVLSDETVIFSAFNTVRALEDDRLFALGTQLLQQNVAANGYAYLLSSRGDLTIVDSNRQITRPEGQFTTLAATEEQLLAINDQGAIVRFRGTEQTTISAAQFPPDAKLYPGGADHLWVVSPSMVEQFDVTTENVVGTWPLDRPLDNIAVNASGVLFAWEPLARQFRAITGTPEIETSGAGDVVNVRESTVVGDRVYYVGENSRGKRSLWTMDGAMSESIRLGVFSGLANLTTDGERLYFTAEHTIWESDGTSAGTRPAGLVDSEGINATADHLQVIGRDMYFAASDGIHGIELFSTPLQLPSKPGDANGDGVVNFADFLALSANFGADGTADESAAMADFDRSGIVDFADFLLLTNNFDPGS